MALAVIGCQPKQSSRAVFDNYLYRLSNSLDVKVESKPPAALLAHYPEQSSVSHDIPALNISMLEFLQLSKCDLQRLIGERNSSLGRLMTGYHALLYEYEFLLLAEQCLQVIGPKDSLHAELGRAITHKKNYQGQLYWNATFASEEVSYLFSLGSQPLTHQQLSNNPSELISALEDLHAWLSDPTTESQQLEHAYKMIGTRKYIGELRLTMAATTAALEQATSMIDERVSPKPLCYQQRSNQKFEVVDRVFHRFYIGEVQPLLAKVHQQGQTLFNLIDQLQNSLEPSKPFADFWGPVYQSEDSEWQSFNRAVDTHTKAWQNLLRQCGALPS